MRRLFIAALIPLLFGISDAEAQQEYVKLDEINFDNEFEKAVLTEALNNSSTTLKTFLVISPEDSTSFDGWSDFFDRNIQEIGTAKRSKKMSKDVKYVYNELHDRFLRKYRNLAYLDEVFESGVYNCVTAVAVYAIAFDELAIPYEIKETPTHVYIVVDPAGSSILIETTNPVSGFQDFGPGFRESFVAQLGAMKLVDQNDINTKGIYGVFDEYYYGGASLSLHELVGIQYYNKGVEAFEDRDYHEAWNALSKSQLFYQNQQINSMLFASLISILSSSDYSDWQDISMLPYMERFGDFDVKQANIIGEFNRMLGYVLITRNDLDKADRAYNLFVENSDDSLLISEIGHAYHYERAVIEYNRANYLNALKYSSLAYQAMPGNSSTENILRESFLQAYQQRSSLEALETLDTLLSSNPLLENNNHFKSLKVNLCLEAMGEMFDDKKPNEGLQYKTEFESLMQQELNYRANHQSIGNAYSKAAVYYYKRGYTTKARNILREGLKFAPDNYELKTRMRMVNY